MSLTPPPVPVYALVRPPLTFGEKEGARTPVPPSACWHAYFLIPPISYLDILFLSIYLSISLCIYLSTELSQIYHQLIRNNYRQTEISSQ